MTEQQSALNSTLHAEPQAEPSQLNPPQEAVSGLLSLLLDQWEDQELDVIFDDIPVEEPVTGSAAELPGTSEIADLNVSLERLSHGAFDYGEPEPTAEEPCHADGLPVSEMAQETTSEQVEPVGELLPELDLSDDGSLVQLFAQIEVEEALPELDPHQEICVSADSTPVSEAAIADESPEGTDVVESASTEPEKAQVAAEQESFDRPGIIPLEPSWLYTSVDESFDDSLELGEDALKDLFDNLSADSDGMDDWEAAVGEFEFASRMETSAADSAQSLEAEPVAEDHTETVAPATIDEPAEPLEVQSYDANEAMDADLLGLLLGGIAAIEQTPEEEPAAEESVAVVTPPAVVVEPPAPQGPVERFVVFRLGAGSFAVPMQRVVETDRMPRVTFVPGLPATLRGISNLRGDIIPIVDLRHVLGMGETELTVANRLVVVKAINDSSIGLIVDGLGGLGSFWVDRTQQPSPENVESASQPLIDGRGEHKGQPVEVIDLDKMFLATELQELAA